MMIVMNRIRIAGIAAIGISIIIFLAVFAPIILALIAGCFIGAFLVYAALQAAPASYNEEEQEITEDEILFVYDDL